MQGVSVSIPSQSTSAQTAIKKRDPALVAYLTGIHWYDNEYSTSRIEMMLAASCLRFLEGLTTLSFVLELAEEIKSKYKERMKLSLWYSMDILQSIAQEQADATQLQEAMVLVAGRINDVLELLTHRRYDLSKESCD